jgi:hypothetical protein
MAVTSRGRLRVREQFLNIRDEARGIVKTAGGLDRCLPRTSPNRGLGAELDLRWTLPG